MQVLVGFLMLPKTPVSADTLSPFDRQIYPFDWQINPFDRLRKEGDRWNFTLGCVGSGHRHMKKHIWAQDSKIFPPGYPWWQVLPI